MVCTMTVTTFGIILYELEDLILEVMCFRNVWGIFRLSFQFIQNGKILYIRFKNGQKS